MPTWDRPIILLFGMTNLFDEDRVGNHSLGATYVLVLNDFYQLAASGNNCINEYLLRDAVHLHLPNLTEGAEIVLKIKFVILDVCRNLKQCKSARAKVVKCLN